MSSSWLARCARQWTQLYVRWHSDGRYAWNVFTIATPRDDDVTHRSRGHVTCSSRRPTDCFDVEWRPSASVGLGHGGWAVVSQWTPTTMSRPVLSTPTTTTATQQLSQSASQPNQRQRRRSDWLQQGAATRRQERSTETIDSKSRHAAPRHAAFSCRSQPTHQWRNNDCSTPPSLSSPSAQQTPPVLVSFSREITDDVIYA